MADPVLDGGAIEEIAELAERGVIVRVTTIEPEGRKALQEGQRVYLSVPKSVALSDITKEIVESLPNPLMRVGIAKLLSLASFEANRTARSKSARAAVTRTLPSSATGTTWRQLG